MGGGSRPSRVPARGRGPRKGPPLCRSRRDLGPSRRQRDQRDDGVVERLTPLAAAFLHAEDVDPDASLSIGSLAVFAGPAPGFADFRRAVAGRLPLVPRYRQRVRRAPFDLAAPSWVDDPGFDLRRHLHHASLPAPGGPDEVSRFLSRVMTRRLDRARPLWDYWYVDGLAGGRWALLSKCAPQRRGRGVGHRPLPPVPRHHT